MKDAPQECVTVQVRGRDVVLDPNNMKFTEVSLSEYMDKEYAWIDYFGKQLEFANKELLDAEIAYEAEYSRRYIIAKDGGNTENYAKADALSDQQVVAARKLVADRKEVVGLLKAHLKAWDKNHDNAQNRGHTLRKEMEKLNRDIRMGGDLPDNATCNAEDFFKSAGL